MSARLLLLTAMMFTLGLLVPSVRADDSEEEQLQSQIDSLQGQLDELQAEHQGDCDHSGYDHLSWTNNPSPRVLDRGEPLWFEGDLCALDVGLVFAVDIRCHRFEACEADQSENLAQAVYLNYSFDAVAAL
jgi:hypothetical protein